MTRTLPYLRKLGLLLVICILTVALGRASVWLTTSDDQSGLSGAPQVFIWQAETKGFGGYSALIVNPDGAGFIAGSDRQHYITGTLTRDAQGQITGTRDLTHWPVRTSKSDDVTRFQGDLEGLTRLPDGRIGMAFENLARVQIMQAPGELPKSVHKWDVFEDVFGNELFEALATLEDGSLLALFQRGDIAGETPAYRYDGTTFTGPEPFPVSRGFDVSGADLGPDGCLYILERHYGIFTGFQFQLIRMDPGDWDAPRRVLYRAKPMSSGNAEGVSVWQTQAGLTATLITDDGFPPRTPTRIIELPLAPARGCAGQ